jgi:hypothetical protein
MGACPNIKFAQLLSFKKLGKSLYGLADSNILVIDDNSNNSIVHNTIIISLSDMNATSILITKTINTNTFVTLNNTLTGIESEILTLLIETM